MPDKSHTYGLDHFGGEGGVSKTTANGRSPEDLIEAAQTPRELEGVRTQLGDMMMDVQSVQDAYTRKMRSLVRNQNAA